MSFLSRIFNSNKRKSIISTTSSSPSSSNNNPPSTAPTTPLSARDPSVPLTNADKFTFLQELTSSVRHRHKTFYEHLFNVYSHLKAQSCPEEVCDAGLYHSIYGTEFYHFQNNRITREIVRGIIGDYAEEMVYIFCTSRPRFRVIVENRLGLSSQMCMDLCHVEFANLWDQNDGNRYDGQMRMLRETISKLQSGGQVSGGQVSDGQVSGMNEKPNHAA